MLRAVRRRDGRAAEIDEVHAAEVGRAIVDDDELAMIAAMPAPEKPRTLEAIQPTAERSIGADLHAGLAEFVEEPFRRGEAADGVVQQPAIDAGGGPFFERRGNGLARGSSAIV